MSDLGSSASSSLKLNSSSWSKTSGQAAVSADDLSRRIHEAIRTSRPDELGRLLTLRSDAVNLTDSQGRAPVHTAATWNQQKCLDTLLRMGGECSCVRTLTYV